MSYLAYANITEILGMSSTATAYRAKAATLATNVLNGFLNEQTGAYNVGSKIATGKFDPHNASQCGQGFGLFMGIVPEALKKKAMDVLVANVKNTEHIPASAPGKDYPGCTDCGGGAGPHMTAGLFSIKVREHSSAVERCRPHVAISPTVL